MKYSPVILLLLFLALSGCSIQEKPPAVKAPDTVEDALKTKANNPIDNAVKLNRTKKALENQVGTYQQEYKEKMDEAMKE